MATNRVLQRIRRITTGVISTSLITTSGWVLAGCGTSGSGQEPTAWSTEVGASGIPAAGAGTRGSSPDQGRSGNARGPRFTLAFAGDTHFTGRTARLLQRPYEAFGPISESLGNADLTILNLETAVTFRGTPEPKTYHFRAAPTAFAALRAAGVDVVTLANNHALDYGQIGLRDTLNNAEKSAFPVVGAGLNQTQATTAWTTTISGTRIAVLAFSQIEELATSWAATSTRPGLAMALDPEVAAAAVSAARKQADLVIVYNHWGDERNPCANDQQQKLARRLAKAGAQIIIGSHAHTLQGDGYIGGAYVAYGLGNFLWYNSGSAMTSTTGVLRLTVQGTQVVDREFIPARISSTGQPLAVTGTAAAQAKESFEALHSCTGLASSPM